MFAESVAALGDGVWTIQGAGGDIWGTSDQFHCVYQSQAGDGSVSAQIGGQTATDQWAKAGVMLRGSAAADSPFYAVFATPSNGIVVQYRATSGGSATWPASSTSGAAPKCVQVTRTGTTYSAATSSDGSSWTPIAGSSVTIAALSGTVLAGLAVTAHNTGALSTATVAATTPTLTPPNAVLPYAISKTYDDAANTLTQTYPNGEIITSAFDGSGWLNGVSRTVGGTTTMLGSSFSYTGAAGASGTITGMQVGNNAFTYSATFDNAQRLSANTLRRVSDNALLYSTQPTFDAVGNVTSVATTLPAGTDNQAFCYDEQDRLTWAGSTGTAPCRTLTPGTLTAANYTQTFSYDTLGRLTSGPLGAYTYGDAAHKHAATSIGSTYSASYAANGAMTCRAPTNTGGASCAGGTNTNAQQLSYDAEGWLTAWQDKPSAPTTTAAYLYDGEGTRVAQQATTSGTTTTTTYIGTVEEVAASGASTTTTTYYYAGSIRVATAVNGTLSYLSNDALSSVSAAFDANGNATASQLYAPYGSVRYSTGVMPGSYGFTGQHADTATSGLDYYGFRYYDPTAGQFISPDSTLVSNGANLWGLSRYAYVDGNPATKTDPDGHCWPLCTILAGAAIGALVGGGISILSQAATGSCCDWKQVATDTAVGAVSGAVTATLGPVGGVVTTAIVHTAVGAGGQLVTNAIMGKPLGDGVGMAALIGGGAGLLGSPDVAKALGRIAGRAGRHCWQARLNLQAGQMARRFRWGLVSIVLVHIFCLCHL